RVRVSPFRYEPNAIICGARISFDVPVTAGGENGPVACRVSLLVRDVLIMRPDRPSPSLVPHEIRVPVSYSQIVHCFIATSVEDLFNPNPTAVGPDAVAFRQRAGRGPTFAVHEERVLRSCSDQFAAKQVQVQNPTGSFELFLNELWLDRAEGIELIARIDKLVGLNLLDIAVALWRPEFRSRREAPRIEHLAGVA